MFYWTPVENSAKNPDQILGEISEGSRDRIMAASLHSMNTGIIVRLKQAYNDR